MIRFPVLLVAGLVSAVLMELASMAWMQLIPAGTDLTANYFLMVVLPVALVLHFLMALLLWKAFEPAPKTGGALYLGTHIITQGTLLFLLGNPVTDIVQFCATLLVSGVMILFVFNRYFWCPHCVGPV